MDRRNPLFAIEIELVVRKWSCLAAAGGAPRVEKPGWACGHARQPKKLFLDADYTSTMDKHPLLPVLRPRGHVMALELAEESVVALLPVGLQLHLHRRWTGGGGFRDGEWWQSSDLARAQR